MAIDPGFPSGPFDDPGEELPDYDGSNGADDWLDPWPDDTDDEKPDPVRPKPADDDGPSAKDLLKAGETILGKILDIVKESVKAGGSSSTAEKEKRVKGALDELEKAVKAQRADLVVRAPDALEAAPEGSALGKVKAAIAARRERGA